MNIGVTNLELITEKFLVTTSVPITCPKCDSKYIIKQGIDSRGKTSKQKYKCKQQSCNHVFYELKYHKKRYINEARCVECKTVKSFDQFYTQKKSNNGYSHTCKECNKVRLLAINNFKVMVMRLWLKNKTCVDCKNQDTNILQNDHIHNNKSKKKDGTVIKRLKSNSISNLLTELKKTQPVCPVCHRIRTAAKFFNSKMPVKSLYHQNKRKELQKFVNNIKINLGKCALCKLAVEENNTHVFDFDHLITETKVDGVSQMVIDLKSKETIKKEIDKCQLLCANCHCSKTFVEQKCKTINDFTKDQILLGEQYLNETLEISQKKLLKFFIS